ncbi:MAG: hypothetical protein HY047_03135 [Acidobacteria bacterium]|nr:hypothetical protein [Acidobacteriota bacterium]
MNAELCVLYVLFSFASAACGRDPNGPGLFRQYEYEEEMYLSLDGSATLYVNTSIAALNALRGTSFDATPNGRTDRDVFRAYYTTPHTRVTRVSPYRRNGRRFVSVRLDVDDIGKLGKAAPFAWSTYRFRQEGAAFVFTQTVGAAAAKDVGAVGWTGRELVAFRMHVPSKISFHNTGRDVGRGNILAWEQSLADRLRGTPLTLEVRMDMQSILFRALFLFGGMLLLVAIAFALVIWWARKS